MTKTVLLPLMCVLALLSGPAPAQTLRAADHIVAVVNSEPITASDVRERVAVVTERLKRQNTEVPPAAVLEREVLEQVITERTQLQRADELGLQVSKADVEQAALSVAEQNQMTPAQLRDRLRQQGITPEAFREQLRRDLLLQRVTEREVDAALQVTDRDLDDYLLEQRRQARTGPGEINLGHILVEVPEKASAAVVAERQARAQRAFERAQSGDFATAVREFSDASGANGGALGLRPLNRYPALFVEAVKGRQVGDVVGPLRSGAGFHILKLLDRQQASGDAVTQTRVRHILLRPTAEQNEQAVLAQAAQLRQQITTGKADFATLAREYSQDGSAAQGGELGWALPGLFVPEFENAMNALQPGEVSPPVPSRFGVHLIQVQERRQVTPSLAERRDMVRAEVREQKRQEAYAVWARDLRDRAYVEYRGAQP